MNRVLTLFQRWPFAFALLLAIVLLVVNLFVCPSFLSPARLPGTLATLAPFVLVGFASTPSILAGGIDISVGPLATFINCLFVAVLLPAGLGNWYAASHPPRDRGRHRSRERSPGRRRPSASGGRINGHAVRPRRSVDDDRPEAGVGTPNWSDRSRRRSAGFRGPC